jgi:hypothetical protein
MERGQEFPDRLAVCTQEPCRLGHYKIATIGPVSTGTWAGQELPNPSKYFGFVLRSGIVPFTAPINPASFACSYTVSEPSSAASCSSTALRTRSDSRVPPRRAAALSRQRISPETHRNSLIPRGRFLWMSIAMWDRPPGLSAADVRGARTVDQVSPIYERRRQSARGSGENRTVMRWSFIYSRLTFHQICPTLGRSRALAGGPKSASLPYLRSQVTRNWS